MNAHPLEKPKMTAEAYLEFEKTSEIRHEYFRSELFAMTGGSLNHNRISRNIVRSLVRDRRANPSGGNPGIPGRAGADRRLSGGLPG